MESIQLLQEFSNAFGPSGFEDDVLAVARAHAPATAAITEDSLRNLYIRRTGAPTQKPVVMLDAHTDEVGFMVQAVKPNGLLQIIPLGGWAANTVPAHTVEVQNRKGCFHTGVLAAKPLHYLSEAERKAPPDLAKIHIDLGASSAEEIREHFGIGPGAPAAPNSSFQYNESTGIIMGKAFDCRAGCACVLEVIACIEQEDLAVNPVGVLSSQEEVGLRGAVVAARATNPAVAIVFEGCPADDGFAESWAAQTVLGKGPMLRHIDGRMITNPRLMRLVLNIAQRENIPVQEAVRSNGGTNGGTIHLAGNGIPTVVIGLPVRYIHTHTGYAHISDYHNCVKLGRALLRQLSPEIIAGL